MRKPKRYTTRDWVTLESEVMGRPMRESALIERASPKMRSERDSIRGLLWEGATALAKVGGNKSFSVRYAGRGVSRQMGYVYGPLEVIWVAGINKLVPDVDAGLRRLREVALPQEDARMKRTGARGSSIGKIVLYEREYPGRIHLVLAGEKFGC